MNISTLAAIVAAAAGAVVIKHGNRAASSTCGSADVLEELGVVIDLGPEGVLTCVDRVGIGFCFAPVFHPAMRYAGPVRKQLGVPTIFNILGPMANPAQPAASLIGASDATLAPLMAEVFSGRELQAMVVRGLDGLDEVTVGGPTDVWDDTDAGVRVARVDPGAAGIDRHDPALLVGGDARQMPPWCDRCWPVLGRMTLITAWRPCAQRCCSTRASGWSSGMPRSARAATDRCWTNRQIVWPERCRLPRRLSIRVGRAPCWTAGSRYLPAPEADGPWPDGPWPDGPGRLAARVDHDPPRLWASPGAAHLDQPQPGCVEPAQDEVGLFDQSGRTGAGGCHDLLGAGQHGRGRGPVIRTRADWRGRLPIDRDGSRASPNRRHHPEPPRRPGPRPRVTAVAECDP